MCGAMRGRNRKVRNGVGEAEAAAPMSAVFAATIVIGQSAPLTGGSTGLGFGYSKWRSVVLQKVNDAGRDQWQHHQACYVGRQESETALSAANTKALIEQHNAVALIRAARSRQR